MDQLNVSSKAKIRSEKDPALRSVGPLHMNPYPHEALAKHRSLMILFVSCMYFSRTAKALKRLKHARRILAQTHRIVSWLRSWPWLGGWWWVGWVWIVKGAVARYYITCLTTTYCLSGHTGAFFTIIGLIGTYYKDLCRFSRNLEIEL